MKAPEAPRRVRRIVEIVDNRNGTLTTRVYAECEHADTLQTVELLPKGEFAAENEAVMMESVNDKLAISTEAIEGLARDQYVSTLIKSNAA